MKMSKKFDKLNDTFNVDGEIISSELDKTENLKK